MNSPDRGATDFLNRELSVYLDFVRLLAALCVLVGHLDQDGLHAGWMQIGQFSHQAVVAFFVLSGLVISHATRQSRSGWRAYVTARAARIYSVVLPAIVLSFVVKFAGTLLDPSLRAEFFDRDLRWQTLVGTVLFLGESWSFNSSLPWNVPIWSLCYEVWYYVIFGLFVFAPARWRWPAIGLAALISGPAILLLFPIWLLGARLSRVREMALPGVAAGGALWVISLLLMWALHTSQWQLTVQQWLYHLVPGYWRLESAQRFATDYLWGLLIALNFIGFRILGPALAGGVLRLERPLAYAAGFTFSLYLFHRPLTEFLGHFVPNVEQSRLVAFGWLLLVVSGCVALGLVTELRKQQFRGWIASRLGLEAR